MTTGRTSAAHALPQTQESLMERIEQLLSDLRVEVAESRTHLEHISEHLKRLNGRTATVETRVDAIERQAIEAGAAWKVIAGICTLAGSVGAWVFQQVVRP